MNRTLEKTGPVDRVFTAPPSKSYTHRAMIAGALADGITVVQDPLYADDIRLTLRAIRTLGVHAEERENKIVISGCGGMFPTHDEVLLDLGSSGTSMRLVASLALLCGHKSLITGSARMQERPIGPLADALRALGGSVEFLKTDGFPPLRIGGRLAGGPVTIDGSASSQFISSVLLTAPYADAPIGITVPSVPASVSYLDITLDVMREFGARVEQDTPGRFRVSNSDRYRGRTYSVEGDWSSASYFFAMAAVCGGKVTVKNLSPDSVQGDRRFLEALVSMGCTVSYSFSSTTVSRGDPLQGIEIDMSSSPDTVQTLCMVAAVAQSPTRITGIRHLKFKESDRISGTAERLRALGGSVEVTDDSITIRPTPLHGGTINPADDHRTAMSFAVLGMGIGKVTIGDAECVNKSFPKFWESLDGWKL